MLRDGRAVIKLRPSKLLMHTMQSLKICSRTLYTNLQGPRVPTKSAVLFAAVGTRTCMLRDGGGCYKITANKTGLCTRYFLFQYTPRAHIPIYRALGRQKKAQFSLRWSPLARIAQNTENHPPWAKNCMYRHEIWHVAPSMHFLQIVYYPFPGTSRTVYRQPPPWLYFAFYENFRDYLTRG